MNFPGHSQSSFPPHLHTERLFPPTPATASLLQDPSAHSCANRPPQGPAQSPAAWCQEVKPSTCRQVGPAQPSSGHACHLSLHPTPFPVHVLMMFPQELSLLPQDLQCSLFPVRLSFLSPLPSSGCRTGPCRQGKPCSCSPRHQLGTSLDTGAVQGSITNGWLHGINPAQATGSCRLWMTASSTSLQLLNRRKSLLWGKIQPAKPR